jgi:hypothetical protein
MSPNRLNFQLPTLKHVSVLHARLHLAALIVDSSEVRIGDDTTEAFVLLLFANNHKAWLCEEKVCLSWSNIVD